MLKEFQNSIILLIVIFLPLKITSQESTSKKISKIEVTSKKSVDSLEFCTPYIMNITIMEVSNKKKVISSVAIEKNRLKREERTCSRKERLTLRKAKNQKSKKNIK
ncbi:hypothetical protein ACOSP6_10080 [Tenacibaculum sp. MEBiC06402]|uniref:hypothetical protein n=1 Tax=unclassified Tenacibaculum TaxID=2635139 RepID=UPI003B991DAF